MSARGTLVSAAAGAGAGIAVVGHAVPALAGISGVRRLLFPALAGIGDSGHVALTFDDGPDPSSTPEILAALSDLGWRATFFMLGDMTRRTPGLASDVAAAGHEVAVHGDQHLSMLRRAPRAAFDDIRRARDTIADASGTEPHWFRPPYGTLSMGAVRATRRLGLETVLWTAWGRDWRPEATAETVVHDVARGGLDGGTVLLHDSDCTSSPLSWDATVGALPLLAELFLQRGLRVGPLGEHGIRGRRATVARATVAA